MRCHSPLTAHGTIGLILAGVTALTGCAGQMDRTTLESRFTGLHERQDRILAALEAVVMETERVDALDTAVTEVRAEVHTLAETVSVLSAQSTAHVPDPYLEAEIDEMRQASAARAALSVERFTALTTRIAALERAQSQALLPPAPQAATPVHTSATTPPDRPGPAPAEPGVSSGTDGMQHVVVRGETLGTITTAYFGSPTLWRMLRDANPQLADSNSIVPGDVLNIPNTAAVGVMAARHTVRRGETLGTVAEIHLGDRRKWRTIWIANPWLSDPNLLEPGQILEIPEMSNGIQLATSPPPVAPAVRSPRMPPNATPDVPLAPVGMGAIQHRIQAGDTLGSVARTYLGHPRKWRVLLRANPWLEDPDRLPVGLTLTVPTPPADAGGAPSAYIKHRVRPGDTLGTIADMYLGDSSLWDAVWAANPNLSSPDQLERGQVIRVPLDDLIP